MAELKTTPTKKMVKSFLDQVEDKTKRADCYKILEIMKQITASEPVMWGDSIVGFGSYHYRYESGREGDWFLAGFSPRKQNLTLYIMSGFRQQEEWLARLGKYKTGKSCLYINKLTDIDIAVLKEMIERSVAMMRKKV